MANEYQGYVGASTTSLEMEIEGIPDTLLDQTQVKEVTLTESLLTPGLQTSIRLHSYIHAISKNGVKNLDLFEGAVANINISKDYLKRWNLPTSLGVSGPIYRLDGRHLINPNTEEMVLHICHRSLLDDAGSLVSKMWKCTTPSAVASEVLQSCAGVSKLDVESSSPARDYAAENIHPFQVVAQQANAALYGGNDPSFIHFMTYDDLGTHHFRSLNSLCSSASKMTYVYDEVGLAGGGFQNPFGLMTHEFPCDFDLLSDVLNGIDETGKDINTLLTFNPLMRMASVYGSKTFGCGIGSGNPKISMSAAGSEQQQNMCPDWSQNYVLKRQARMGLLEQDKIALRFTAPWVGHVHPGNVITLDLKNKENPSLQNYGHGTYLVHSVTHNIKNAGMGTITVDAVSTSVSKGVQ